MTSATLLNLQAVHSQMLAGQQHLLEHMAQQPEAYRACADGVSGYRALSDAASLLWSILDSVAVANAIDGLPAWGTLND